MPHQTSSLIFFFSFMFLSDEERPKGLYFQGNYMLLV